MATLSRFLILSFLGALSASAGAATPLAGLPALEAAAENGDPEAQAKLAQKYEHGEGVARNPERAVALYCRASRGGSLDAQYRLGWMYANGRGVGRDDGLSGLFLKMAADQGHEYAKRMLRYVRANPDQEVPPCLRPEPPPPVEAMAEPDEIEVMFAARTEIVALVKQLAPEYGVDHRLALALISVESGFNPGAVSPKNAQGLMQLIPATAERFGVKRVFNPAENVRGGLAYLRWLLAFFEGQVPLVLAAYNAGEGAVEKYRGIPPYAETRAYVQRIQGMYRKDSHPFRSDIVAPSPVMTKLRLTRG